MRKFLAIILIIIICIPVLSIADESKTISVDKTEFYENEKIRVNYTEADDKDWVGIYPRGSYPGEVNESGAVIGSLQWGYLPDIDGEFVFPNDLDPTSRTEPLLAGEYDLYYLKNDGYDIADHIEFTIIEGSDSIKPHAPIEITYERTATTKGLADGIVKITKPNTGPELDEYILYWSNASGKIKDHSPIATIKVDGDVTDYTMPNSIFIPKGTTSIIAYSKSGSSISDNYARADVDASTLLGNDSKLYSFNVITDIHIGANYDTNLKRALNTILKKSPDTIGIFTVGDNTENGKLEQYKKLMDVFESELSNKDIPAYFTLGNHDMIGDFDHQVELFKEHTNMSGVYHHTVKNGTYFIHLGNEDPDSWSNPVLISENQFNWLEDLLEEASKSKGPIFVFLHQPIYNTVAGSLPGQGWDGVRNPEILRNLLDKYPQILLFSGHTHWKFDSNQVILNGNGSKANYINSSAVSYLWTDDDTHYDGSQGYFVDVYKDYVLIKGYDFDLDEWSSCAQFLLSIESDFPTESNPTPTPNNESEPIDDTNLITIIIISVFLAIVVIVAIIFIVKKLGKKK